ncbi:hypothetical protein C463_16127 [Halorubrum californiense DSM 19288]|uniref:Uncharacterized protein n=1 Tax=Halorubrum californiense DSM 19288 TaxID=1227465 RepID=M0DX42_9EURY|nr:MULTISPECIES: DUF5779 family protein [Halorubrum]ELZ40046.1 hypothetical protein C463_16127 [Halorubrum californiense DSM 19288]TKX73232.1 hypothetical protein EXE40_00450 [Halorubrum sp. GN11GM_10-3_MGM]
MSDWDLDLRDAEAKMDEAFAAAGDVVLGVLDGTTDPEEWVRSVDYGNTLVLSIEGDLNELAAPFARDVKEMDGELMHFRGFLVVTPPGVSIEADRLSDSAERADGDADETDADTAEANSGNTETDRADAGTDQN